MTLRTILKFFSITSKQKSKPRHQDINLHSCGCIRLSSRSQLQPLRSLTGNVMIDSGRIVTQEEIDLEWEALNTDLIRLHKKLKTLNG